MAERLDRAYDALSSVPQADPQDIEMWITEITPFFSYEGDDPTTMGFGNEFVNYYFEFFNGGGEFNHIAGYTYCEGTVFLNARLMKQLSAWYSRDMFLGTLTHEMIHNLKGAYCSADSRQAESRTQLGMLEVLPAMANQGNRQALKALVGELADIYTNTYEFEMLQADRRLSSLTGSPPRLPMVMPSRWRGSRSPTATGRRTGTHFGILDRYSNYVFQDMADFRYRIWMPTASVDAMRTAYIVQMDDLKYLLNHLDAMVEAALP